LILICPWLNANPNDPAQPAIEPRDAILTLNGIMDCGKMYADDLAIDDPRVSPIFGEWDRLPPILCFGGGDDILVTDARALKARSPEIQYDERAGLIHVWPILPFPESRAAQNSMASFAASL
jgi:acetyl esterase/lipase